MNNNNRTLNSSNNPFAQRAPLITASSATPDSTNRYQRVPAPSSTVGFTHVQPQHVSTTVPESFRNMDQIPKVKLPKTPFIPRKPELTQNTISPPQSVNQTREVQPLSSPRSNFIPQHLNFNTAMQNMNASTQTSKPNAFLFTKPLSSPQTVNESQMMSQQQQPIVQQSRGPTMNTHSRLPERSHFMPSVVANQVTQTQKQVQPTSNVAPTMTMNPTPAYTKPTYVPYTQSHMENISTPINSNTMSSPSPFMNSSSLSMNSPPSHSVRPISPRNTFTHYKPSTQVPSMSLTPSNVIQGTAPPQTLSQSQPMPVTTTTTTTNNNNNNNMYSTNNNNNLAMPITSTSMMSTNMNTSAILGHSEVVQTPVTNLSILNDHSTLNNNNDIISEQDFFSSKPMNSPLSSTTESIPSNTQQHFTFMNSSETSISSEPISNISNQYDTMYQNSRIDSPVIRHQDPNVTFVKTTNTSQPIPSNSFQPAMNSMPIQTYPLASPVIHPPKVVSPRLKPMTPFSHNAPSPQIKPPMTGPISTPLPSSSNVTSPQTSIQNPISSTSTQNTSQMISSTTQIQQQETSINNETQLMQTEQPTQTLPIQSTNVPIASMNPSVSISNTLNTSNIANPSMPVSNTLNTSNTLMQTPIQSSNLPVKKPLVKRGTVKPYLPTNPTLLPSGASTVETVQQENKQTINPFMSNKSSTMLASDNLNSLSEYEERMLPKPVVSFGFPGKIVLFKPIFSQSHSLIGSPYIPGEVEIKNVSELISKSTTSQSLVKYPGPLMNKNKYNEVKTFITYMIDSTKVNTAWNTLWKLLQVFIESNGVIGKERTTSTRDKVINILLSLSDMTLESPPNDPLKIFNTLNEDSVSILIQIQDLVLRGQIEEAVDICMEHNLWSYALLFSNVKKDIFMDTAMKFIQKAFPINNSLFLILPLIMSNSNFSITPSCIPVWNRILVGLISYIDNDKNVVLIKQLGELLLQNNQICEAHICFILSGRELQSYLENANYCLLGGQFGTGFRPTHEQNEWASEIYEYGMTLNNPLYVCKSLLPHKLLYTMKLVEFGFIDKAQEYISNIYSIMKQSHDSTVINGFTSQVSQLKSRLDYSLNPLDETETTKRPSSTVSTPRSQDGTEQKKAGSFFMSKILSSLDYGIQTLVTNATGEPEPESNMNMNMNESTQSTVMPSGILNNNTSIQTLMNPSSTLQNSSLPPMSIQPSNTLPSMNAQPNSTLPPMNVQPSNALPPMGMQPNSTLPPMGMQPSSTLPPMNVQPNNTLPPSTLPPMNVQPNASVNTTLNSLTPITNSVTDNNSTIASNPPMSTSQLPSVSLPKPTTSSQNRQRINRYKNITRFIPPSVTGTLPSLQPTTEDNKSEPSGSTMNLIASSDSSVKKSPITILSETTESSLSMPVSNEVATTMTPPMTEAPPMTTPPITTPPMTEAPPITTPPMTTPPMTEAPPMTTPPMTTPPMTTPPMTTPPITDAPPMTEAPPMTTPPMTEAPPMTTPPPASMSSSLPQSPSRLPIQRRKPFKPTPYRPLTSGIPLSSVINNDNKTQETHDLQSEISDVRSVSPVKPVYESEHESIQQIETMSTTTSQDTNIDSKDTTNHDRSVVESQTPPLHLDESLFVSPPPVQSIFPANEQSVQEVYEPVPNDIQQQQQQQQQQQNDVSASIPSTISVNTITSMNTNLPPMDNTSSSIQTTTVITEPKKEESKELKMDSKPPLLHQSFSTNSIYRHSRPPIYKSIPTTTVSDVKTFENRISTQMDNSILNNELQNTSMTTSEMNDNKIDTVVDSSILLNSSMNISTEIENQQILSNQENQDMDTEESSIPANDSFTSLSSDSDIDTTQDNTINMSTSSIQTTLPLPTLSSMPSKNSLLTKRPSASAFTPLYTSSGFKSETSSLNTSMNSSFTNTNTSSVNELNHSLYTIASLSSDTSSVTQLSPSTKTITPNTSSSVNTITNTTPIRPTSPMSPSKTGEKTKRRLYDDDDDDLDSKLKKNNISPAPAVESETANSSKGTHLWGLFGFFGRKHEDTGKKVYVVDLPEDTVKPYYDQQLNKWVFPGESEQSDTTSMASPPMTPAASAIPGPKPSTTPINTNDDMHSLSSASVTPSETPIASMNTNMFMTPASNIMQPTSTPVSLPPASSFNEVHGLDRFASVSPATPASPSQQRENNQADIVPSPLASSPFSASSPSVTPSTSATPSSRTQRAPARRSRHPNLHPKPVTTNRYVNTFSNQ